MSPCRSNELLIKNQLDLRQLIIKMDKEKLQNKLKTLSHKNKKLLQSISTHLINNPDQLEGKLHEHRFLEQKYNQLIGFSRQNVERYEKIQAMLLVKDQEIKRLNKMLAESKDQTGYRMENIDRDYRKKRAKDEEEIENYKTEVNSLKKEMAENKQKFNHEKKRLESELQSSKRAFTEKAEEAQKLGERLKEVEGSLDLRQKDFDRQIEEQKKKIRILEEENERLKKKKTLESFNEIRAQINNHRKRNV